MDRASLPAVSVVVVNYRGAEDTITCVRGLAEVDYPAGLLQVIVVDNEAHDTARLKAELAGLPGVKVVSDDRNLGFAGGCNLGVEYATGDVLAFLNNDARADRNWIKAAIRVFHAEPSVGAVASKVLDWDGKKIDFVDGGLTWFGMGYKRHVGETDDGSHDARATCCSAPGRRCSCGPRSTASSAGSTSGSSCSTRTSTSAGG